MGRTPASSCLAAFVALSAVSGLVSGFAAPGSAVETANMLIGGGVGLVLLALWLRFDARAHAYRLRPIAIALILLLAIVGVPLYLLGSRGVKRGSIAILRSGAFLLLNIFVAFVFLFPGLLFGEMLAGRR